jgi:uncharacterized protein
MTIIATFITGFLFGLGLVVSGMTNPAKVQNFLDVFGAWDASLLFTMGGAVVTTAIGFWLVFKRQRPMFSQVFHIPSAADIDGRLIVGSALFGIGWGLVGYCPGPAITALPFGGAPTLTFVVSMLAGMGSARVIHSLFNRAQPARH